MSDVLDGSKNVEVDNGSDERISDVGRYDDADDDDEGVEVPPPPPLLSSNPLTLRLLQIEWGEGLGMG